MSRTGKAAATNSTSNPNVVFDSPRQKRENDGVTNSSSGRTPLVPGGAIPCSVLSISDASLCFVYSAGFQRRYELFVGE